MTDLEMLATRLTKLESRYRRMQRTALILCLLMAAGAIMAQTLPPVNRPTLPGEIHPQRSRQEMRVPVSDVVEGHIRANQFTLVDTDGRERASLVADGAGSVFLVLFDRNERSRVNLSVSNDGPSLVLYDPSGQARTVLGSTTLVSSHVNEKGIMERAPASSIVLFDRTGKLLFRTP